MGSQRVGRDWATKRNTAHTLYGGFPGGISGKEPACQCRKQRHRFEPWAERSPGGGRGNLLQYSCQENPLTDEPGELQSIGSQRVHTHRHTLYNVQCVCVKDVDRE